MLIKKVGVVVLLGVLLAGCGNKLSKEEIAEYHRMKAIADSMNVEIEYSKYEEAVLFLVNPESVNREYVDAEKSKYSEVMTDRAIRKLWDAGYDSSEDIVEDEVDYPDNYDEEVPEFEEEEENYEENGLYPIYDQFYSVVDYGTKEEMEESIEAFMSLPVNTIKGVTAYPDILVVRILNKFTGEYAITLKLKEGKIDDYETFR